MAEGYENIPQPSVKYYEYDSGNFNDFPVHSIARLSGSTFTNTPGGDSSFWGIVETIAGSTDVYRIQKAYLLSAGKIQSISYRSYSYGTWYPWVTVYHM